MGRPPKLTPQMQQEIIKALQAGSYFETACEMVGITSRTGYNWLRWGERDETETSPYFQFFRAVKNAQATDEVLTIAAIKRVAQGGILVAEKTIEFPDGRTVTERTYSKPDWTADAWRMERKYPDRWGRRDRMDVTLLIQREAEKIAEKYGMTAEEVIREAELIMAGEDDADC